jgi:hypothetical protein
MPKWIVCVALAPLVCMALLGWMVQSERDELETARKCCVGPLGDR